MKDRAYQEYVIRPSFTIKLESGPEISACSKIRNFNTNYLNRCMRFCNGRENSPPPRPLLPHVRTPRPSSKLEIFYICFKRFGKLQDEDFSLAFLFNT